MENNLEKYNKTLIENMCRYFGYTLFQVNENPVVWGIQKIDENGKNIKAIFNQGNFHNDSANEFIKIAFFNPNAQFAINPNSKAVVLIDYVNNKIQSCDELVDRAFINELAKCLRFADNVKEEKALRKGSIVTITIIAINVLMYVIASMLSGDFINSSDQVLLLLGAKVNELITGGEYYRLITSMFLHGGLIHILLNMYALYSIGPIVEKIYGPKKYIVIYFVSGILSSLLSYIMSPAMSIGASGAIFGLLGALLVYAYKMRKRIGKGLIKNIVTVIGINLFIGMTIPNIDNFAHVGGLIGGLVISYYFFNILKK